MTKSSSIYDFEVKTIDGKDISMKEFEGKTLLIVNTASECGFTKQYEGLEKLYKKHKDAGLVVLGFPCNQFGGQEKGKEEEIESFCKKNFGVTFPLFSKIDVNGSNSNPLFEFLKSEKPGIFNTKGIKWNFTKFLVDPSGKVLKRFSPNEDPMSFESQVVNVIQ